MLNNFKVTSHRVAIRFDPGITTGDQGIHQAGSIIGFGHS